MIGIDDIDTTTATLPSRYNAAKAALRDCTSVDECKEWTDKASALASYAKQAKDDQLEKMAKRIRARATRRAGELLKQMDDGRGGDRRSDDFKNAATVTFETTREKMASDAGLSSRQATTAKRLANIPESDFEQMVERDATNTQMAEAGTQKRAPSRDAAKALVAAVRAYAERIGSINIDEAGEALSTTQKAELRMLIGRLDTTHDRIITSI